jgi:hypothetical protein
MHVEKRKKRPALSPFPTFFLPEAAHPCAVPFSPPTAGPASPNRRRATLFARRRHSPVRPANRHAPLLLRPLARPSAPPAAGAPRRALPEQDASAAMSCALYWNSLRPPPRPSLCFLPGRVRGVFPKSRWPSSRPAAGSHAHPPPPAATSAPCRLQPRPLPAASSRVPLLPLARFCAPSPNSSASPAAHQGPPDLLRLLPFRPSSHALLHASRPPFLAVALVRRSRRESRQNFKNLPVQAGNGERRRTKSSDSCAC